MTAITAQPATTAVPDAIDATPGQAPVQQPATGRPCPTRACHRWALPPGACPGGCPGGALVPGVGPGGRDGPLRSGNPRGNPHLAPRCGAKARRTGCACRASLPAVGLAPGRLSRGLTRGAMANGRCRSHGGKSTGPRTPEGLASVARAHTTHGLYGASGAPRRAEQRYRRTLLVRSRLLAKATRLQAHLRPEMAARLEQGPPELAWPKHPSQVAFEAKAASTGCSVSAGGGVAGRGGWPADPRDKRAGGSPRRRRRCCVGGKPSWRGHVPRRRRWPRGRRRWCGRG